MTKESLCEIAIKTEEAMQTIVCIASSTSKAQWLTLLVIFISALIAFAGLRSSREIARRKATLDLIEKAESTEFYRKLHATFAYYKSTKQFSRLHAPEEAKDKSDRNNVLDFLSHYELVSIGIECKILDRDFYHNWMANPFVRDWNAAAEFIQRERWKWHPDKGTWEYYPRLFETYQRVAEQFSNDAIKLDENFSPPPETPMGPGDKPLPESNETSC